VDPRRRRAAVAPSFCHHVGHEAVLVEGDQHRLAPASVSRAAFGSAIFVAWVKSRPWLWR
jgi:hypothetical protein